MGVETALAIGGVSALGGAVKGAKGTPDQVQNSTTTNSVAAPGAQEQQLQQQSLANYNQANTLAGQYEDQTQGAQTFQDQARRAAGGILDGSAFNVTPEEQARIQGLRDALYTQGAEDVAYNEQQGLRGVLQSAGGRGLRGQALGALQGQVLDSGTRARSSVSNQANASAAQAYMAAPGQRIAAQQGVIGQGMSLADSLRQQAIQNRTTLQNPALLGYYQQNRQMNATSATQGVTPGQKGGLGGAIGGALGGLGTGMQIGGGIVNGISDLRGAARVHQLGGDRTNDKAVLDARNFYMGL